MLHDKNNLVINDEMVVNFDNVFTLYSFKSLCFFAYLKGIARSR